MKLKILEFLSMPDIEHQTAEFLLWAITPPCQSRSQGQRPSWTKLKPRASSHDYNLPMSVILPSTKKKIIRKLHINLDPDLRRFNFLIIDPLFFLTEYEIEMKRFLPSVFIFLVFILTLKFRHNFLNNNLVNWKERREKVRKYCDSEENAAVLKRNKFSSEKLYQKKLMENIVNVDSLHVNWCLGKILK